MTAILTASIFIFGIAGIGAIAFALVQDSFNKSFAVLGGISISIAILSGILSSMILSVRANEAVILFNEITGETSDPIPPGTHFKNLWVNDVVRYRFVVREQTFNGDQAVATNAKDGQDVLVDITVTYRIRTGLQSEEGTQECLSYIYQTYVTEENMHNTVVIPQMRGVLRDQVAFFNALELFGSNEAIAADLGVDVDETVTNVSPGRVLLKNQVFDVLEQQLHEECIDLQEVIIRDINLDPTYIALIQQRLQAREANLAAQEDQRRQLTEADTAQQVRTTNAEAAAEEARINAESAANVAEVNARSAAQVQEVESASQANAITVVAEAEANAEQLRLQAQAVGYEAIGSALSGNEEYARILFVEGLSDNIEIIYIPTGQDVINVLGHDTQLGTASAIAETAAP